MRSVIFFGRFSHDSKYFRNCVKVINPTCKDIKSSYKTLNVFVGIFTLLYLLGLWIYKSHTLRDAAKELSFFDIKRKQKKYGFNSKSITFKIWYWLFSITGVLAYVKYLLYFRFCRVDLICLWNGYSSVSSGVIRAALESNVKVAYFENGFLPNTTAVDFKGINFCNSVPRSAEFYSEYVTEGKDTLPAIVQRAFNPKKTVVAGDISSIEDLPAKFVFVPFQVYLDTQIILPVNSPKIRDMEGLFDFVIAVKDLVDSEVVFVFKEHPSCDRKYPHLHEMAKKSNERILFANTIPTSQLLAASLCVITVNSSVGMEAIISKKPVITLGNTFYSFAGNPSVMHAENPARVAEYVTDVYEGKTVVNENFNNKFLSFLYNDFLVRGSWRDANHEHYKSVIEKLRFILDERGYLK